MSLFLVTYFFVYGLLHLYLFLKARAAFHFGLATGVTLGVFMVVMMATPVAVRLMARQGAIVPGRALAYLGYSWMGLVFLLFCLSLCVDLYNLAKVVLCTSRSDLLPFALLEASACGQPVVATDVGAVADIVENGHTGSLVPVRDEDGFCRAVEMMLNDEERRLQCGRAARARAEACFDVRLTAKRLVEVYHAAAG